MKTYSDFAAELLGLVHSGQLSEAEMASQLCGVTLGEIPGVARPSGARERRSRALRLPRAVTRHRAITY